MTVNGCNNHDQGCLYNSLNCVKEHAANVLSTAAACGFKALSSCFTCCPETSLHAYEALSQSDDSSEGQTDQLSLESQKEVIEAIIKEVFKKDSNMYQFNNDLISSLSADKNTQTIIKFYSPPSGH